MICDVRVNDHLREVFNQHQSIATGLEYHPDQHSHLWAKVIMSSVADNMTDLLGAGKNLPVWLAPAFNVKDFDPDTCVADLRRYVSELFTQLIWVRESEQICRLQLTELTDRSIR